LVVATIARSSASRPREHRDLPLLDRQPARDREPMPDEAPTTMLVPVLDAIATREGGGASFATCRLPPDGPFWRRFLAATRRAPRHHRRHARNRADLLRRNAAAGAGSAGSEGPRARRRSHCDRQRRGHHVERAQERRRGLHPEEISAAPLSAAEIETIYLQQLRLLIDKHRLAQAVKSFGVFTPEQIEMIFQRELTRQEQEQLRDFGSYRAIANELKRQGQTWGDRPEREASRHHVALRD
jgi:hypothetical protein